MITEHKNMNYFLAFALDNPYSARCHSTFIVNFPQRGLINIERKPLGQPIPQ